MWVQGAQILTEAGPQWVLVAVQGNRGRIRGHPNYPETKDTEIAKKCFQKSYATLSRNVQQADVRTPLSDVFIASGKDHKSPPGSCRKVTGY